MGCILSFFKFNNNKSYKVAETGGEDKSSHHGRKSSKKQQQQQQQYHTQEQQQSGHNLEKPLGKNVLPLSNQSFIYKTVLEATVTDANANEEEERIKAAEAPGPFEIETDLLSPEVEEAVIKIQANVRGYLTRKLYRGVTPEPDRSVETSQQSVQKSVPSQEPIESSNEQPKSSSGILAPPPSFSDTPKELPLDDVDDNLTAANQGKRIAEKLIELERQVSQQAINEPSESKVDDVITSRKEDNSDYGIAKNNFKQPPVDCVGTKLKSQSENNQQNRIEDEISLSQRSLGIPSIETSEVTGPEEAAIKIQAAFRGYQVRKTISRETSPCHTREDEGNGQDVVHLREKDGTFTQDPERESILVLNQLEECLSQELMRSSVNLEDETSLSSYSTDIDLNASLKSNVSLMDSSMKSTHNDIADFKSVSIGSGDLSASNINNQLEQPSIGNEQSIEIPETIKDNVNNEQIVGASQFDPLISTVNQVLLDVQTADRPHDCLGSLSKTEDQIETITTEPVLLVPIDEKVNALDGSLKDDNLVDPVLIVQINGKVDASQVTSSVDLTAKKMTEEEPESIETIETKSESTQLKADTKLEVDTDSTSGVNESTSSTDLHQPSEDMKGPEIEPSVLDMPPPLIQSIDEGRKQKVAAKDDPVNPPQTPELITSSVTGVVHSSLSDTSVKQSDLTTVNSKSIIVIDASAQELQQKMTKLIKEDSFGSDILILDDEKNDSLYDPFIDDLTTPLISSNVQQSNVDVTQLTTSTTFVEDNLVKSVVDDTSKDEGLVLYEANSKSTIDSETISRLPDDNITEVKDDILVDLDESDDEDEDSQKRPIEESPNSEPKSPIIINIHRPSDAQEVELILAEKSNDLDEGITKFEEQLITKQPDSQNGRTPSQSNEVPVVTSIKDAEDQVQRTTDLELEPRDGQSTETVDITKQSTINHDKSSIEDVASQQISTNPFLDQPDFDSDIESGKIILNNQSPKSLQDDREIVLPKESELVETEQSKVDVESAGVTDLETTITKDKSKDSELPTKLDIDDHSSSPILSSIQSRADENSNSESLTPSSSSAINQPSVLIEPIDIDSIEQNVPTNEQANGDPDEDETANLPDSLISRLQERETRSRSPNPFGRKKRRQKKNRGGAN